MQYSIYRLGHQPAHFPDLHTGARTWALCCKNIYEKTPYFQYIKLKFCMVIALGMPNNIYIFRLGSVSETRCAWCCPDLSPRQFPENISLGGNCANNRISLLYIHALCDTLHDISALYYWIIYKDISSFVECSVHNVVHVVASAGTGGRLGPMAIHASRPAGMHKIQSLLTYVTHVQSPRIFQETLYIFFSQQFWNCKQIAQNLMSLRGDCPWAKPAYMRHWKGPNSRLKKCLKNC